MDQNKQNVLCQKLQYEVLIPSVRRTPPTVRRTLFASTTYSPLSTTYSPTQYVVLSLRVRRTFPHHGSFTQHKASPSVRQMQMSVPCHLLCKLRKALSLKRLNSTSTYFPSFSLSLPIEEKTEKEITGWTNSRETENPLLHLNCNSRIVSSETTQITTQRNIA